MGFWTIPNVLTLSRAAAIPAVIASHTWGFSNLALGLLTWSLLSDFFDGYLARRWNQVTGIGSILDPIADKFVALAYYGWLWALGLTPAWFAALVLVRNFAQLLSVPILSWWLKRTFSVKPKNLPRWATALSQIYVFVPLFAESWFAGSPAREALWILMGVIAILEIQILVTYVPRLIAIACGRHDTFE